MPGQIVNPLLLVCPTLVHRKWTKGSGKRLWGLDPDQLEGHMPPFLPDVAEVREDMADYFGEIQAFDAALGLILKRLEELGELDRTVVIISGDHGPPGFPHGKCNLYDFGVGVPLAIHWPGQPGGRKLEDFVNLMDLAPTVLELAGVDVPSVMPGKSPVPQLQMKHPAGSILPKLGGHRKERHVAAAIRQCRLPSAPFERRTLYIVNFQPDRWPMGDPLHRLSDTPTSEQLRQNTFATFADMDASPTKGWIFEHRKITLGRTQSGHQRPFGSMMCRRTPIRSQRGKREFLRPHPGKMHEQLMAVLR